jgi:alpha-galactosidase
MGMWAMLASPLLAGNNLSKLTPEVTSILTNRDVIAIDQDALGKQADRIFAEGPVEIWSRPLSNGDVALAVFNFGEDETFLRDVSLHLDQAGAGHGWKAHDVWSGKNLGKIDNDYKFSLPRHASLLLRLSR